MSLRQPSRTSQRATDEAAEEALPALPALRVLWEEANAPGAGRAEVDALLWGLALPLGEGESARERADLLHRLIDDEHVGSFQGSDGRRVRGAAAQALVALGHPYALELSPDALDAMREAGRAARRGGAEGKGLPVVFTTGQHVGFWLALVMSLVETLLVVGVGSKALEALVLGLGFVAVTGYGPAFGLATEDGVRNRALHWLGLILSLLPALLWLGAAFLVFFWSGFRQSASDPWYLLPLVGGLTRCMATWCLHAESPERER